MRCKTSINLRLSTGGCSTHNEKPPCGREIAILKTPEIALWDGFFEPMYGMPNQAGLNAITLLARSEGILLDPVYTGKAMAGLIDYLENSNEKTPVLFVHTGGAPALFAYPEINKIVNQ